MTTKINDNDAWKAVSARDRTRDALFVFAVKTTGIFCKPSCPARRPLRRNVVFYESYADAVNNGYRPCKRCKPHPRMGHDARAGLIADACRRLQNAEDTAPSLAELAGHAGLSPHHFQKLFKAVAGVSPKEYAVAIRSDKIRRRLQSASSVTEAIYGAGYNAASRFYEKADDILGMTPSDYKNGGAGLDLKFALGACSLGTILVAASPKGICAISLGDDPETLIRDLQDCFHKANLIGGDAGFEATVAHIVGLVENPRAHADLPLDIRGTAFQHKVWKALCAIPVGCTVSYQEIAKTIGAPTAARAVATACAANKLAVAIPCHRVVRRDGGLSGYRWGIARKRKLLARETDA